MKKNYHFILLFSVFLILFSINLTAQEDKFKALFIYNFTKYVEWPSNSQTDFIIAIVGKSHIEEELKNIAQKMKIGNKPITIKVYSSIDEIKEAQIIYISNRTDDIPILVNKAKTMNSLLICNIQNSCQQGSCINFINKSGNLGFEISGKNITSCGLRVNSSLMALGTSVD